MEPLAGRPSFTDTNCLRKRYQKVQALLQASMGNRPLVLNSAVTPYWIEETDYFWYVREMYVDDQSVSKNYCLVDAGTGSISDAFDHTVLAAALSECAEQSVLADQLPIADVGITLSPRVVTFTAFDSAWEYNDGTECCRRIAYNSNRDCCISPDGHYEAFIRDHNIWLRQRVTGIERQLTSDGERFYAYGEAPTVTGKLVFPLVDLLWSPDGTRLITQRIDTREVQTASPLVQHVPGDGIQPTLLYEGRKKALLGDEVYEAWQLLSIAIDNGHIQRLDHKPFPMNYPPHLGYFVSGRAWWDRGNRHAYCIYQDRDRTHTQVIRWDTQTGQSAVLFAENPDLQAILADRESMRVMATPLPDSDELVWYSERDGWAHLYLIDLNTGAVKIQITSGDWLVREIIKVDTERRELWIKTAGRVVGHNPYHAGICRVNIDSTELTPVTFSDHHFSANGIKSFQPFYCTLSSISPSNQYVVTTCSRIDEVPVTVLLDRNGDTLLVLESADVSALPENWQWPEVTQTLPSGSQSSPESSDSNIYGMIFKPSFFSPEESYPVLDFSCVLMAEPVTPFAGGLYLEAAAYAELGFVVVKFFNRALFGFRSKSFFDLQDRSVPLVNLSDNVAAIKQLAEQRPYMDVNRVGVTLHSSYPTALSGLLIHHDFYKVGVTYNPITHAHLMAPLGYGEEFPQYEIFAANLKGKLLLIAGMLDYTVSVANTFRMVEALQKANKSFDMLVLPALGHDFTGYAKKRQLDYLVEHLLGEKPPADFQLSLADD